jgi:hypothetical protein
MSICGRCNGVGMVHCEACDGASDFSDDFCTGCANTSMMECPVCDGTGKEGDESEPSTFETELLERETNYLAITLVSLLSLIIASSIALALYFQNMS